MMKLFIASTLAVSGLALRATTELSELKMNLQAVEDEAPPPGLSNQEGPPPPKEDGPDCSEDGPDHCANCEAEADQMELQNCKDCDDKTCGACQDLPGACHDCHFCEHQGPDEGEVAGQSLVQHKMAPDTSAVGDVAAVPPTDHAAVPPPAGDAVVPPPAGDAVVPPPAGDAAVPATGDVPATGAATDPPAYDPAAAATDVTVPATDVPATLVQSKDGPDCDGHCDNCEAEAMAQNLTEAQAMACHACDDENCDACVPFAAIPACVDCHACHMEEHHDGPDCSPEGPDHCENCKAEADQMELDNCAACGEDKTCGACEGLPESCHDCHFCEHHAPPPAPKAMHE